VVRSSGIDEGLGLPEHRSGLRAEAARGISEGSGQAGAALRGVAVGAPRWAREAEASGIAGRSRGAGLLGLGCALALVLTACLTVRAPSAAGEGPGGEVAEVEGAEGRAPVDGDGPDDHVGLDEGLPEEVVRFAVLTRELGRALSDAGSRCARVAYALDRWTKAHGADYRALLAATDRWEAEVPLAASTRFYAVLFPAIEARVEAGIRCDRDRASRGAFERFYLAVGFAEPP